MLPPVLDFWLQPPVFPGDEQKTRRAGLLNTILWATLVFLVLLVVANVLGQRTRPVVFVLDGLMCLVAVFLLYLLRRGQVAATGGGLTLGAFIFVTAIGFDLGTLRTPTTAAYCFVVILAGLLFDWPGIVASTVASSLAVLALMIAENAGWLPHPDYTVTVTQWFTYCGLFAMTGGLVNYGLQSTRQALARANQEIAVRKRVELELRKLTRAVEQSPASIVITNLAGTIEYVNPRFTQVTGYTFEEALGNNPRILKTGYTRSDTHADLWATLVSGREWRGEFVNRRKDGSLYSESAVISPILDATGKTTHYLAVKEDITEQRRAQAALRESEARFRSYFELPLLGIAMTSLTQQWIEVNDRLLRMLGYEWPELARRTWAEVTHPDDLAADEAQFRQVLTGALDGYVIDKRFLRKDGQVVWTSLAVRCVRHADGTPSYFVAVLQDISERKQAELAVQESEALRRQIMDSSRDLIFAVDHEYRLLAANAAYQTLLVASGGRRLAVGENVLLPDYPSAWLDEWRTAYERALAGETFTLEVHLTLGEADHVIENQFTPLRGAAGQIVGALVVGRDLTERVHMESELRELSQNLEERVRRRTSDLTRVNAELARAARVKDEFLATVSHELRTPLIGILGLTEAVEEGVYGELTPRQRETLHAVLDSGQRELNLVNDLLDLSSIDAGKVELDLGVVDVEAMCQSSLRAIGAAARRKNLRLSQTLDSNPGLVLADARRLRQMLDNLLSNAVKFTPEGGQVGLEVIRDLDTQVVRFTVTDTGIGIPEGKQALLFQPFSQIDSRLARQYGGSGLGLLLVRRLAELHGGSVGVQTTPGQGSRFHFDLPLVLSESPKVVLPEIRLASALVVDDSELAAEPAVRYLRELGADVGVELDGGQVVNRAAAEHPEIILLDLLMNSIADWSILEALKADPRTASIPVIVVSVMDERDRARAQGAAEYLPKPLTRTNLRVVLERVLKPPALARFPLEAQSQPANGKETPAPLVLLAEHNPINLQAFQEGLVAARCRVVLAMDGVEALQRAAEYKPALIMLDQQLPLVSGVDVLRQLRAQPQYAGTPIVMLTALTMPGDRERCLAAGATDFLTKPVSLKKLWSLLQYVQP